jgi:hypothetical protein
MQNAPPTIFSNSRRIAARWRMLRRREDAAQFLIDDMVEDIIERLAFLRHEPGCSLIIGDTSERLGDLIEAQGGSVVDADIIDYSAHHLERDLETPLPPLAYDFIACLGLLDTVNDLPGTLLHFRQALVRGGRAIVSFVGAGSLPVLRRVMLAADADRPAARFHPLVDVRAGAQLLQRAGWADSVADSRTISVAYRSLDRLVGDLRAQGLGNVLANPAPLGKAGLARARAAFAAEADEQGRVVERFEILTLSGKRV